MFTSVVTLVTLQPPTSAFILLAPLNVPDSVARLVVIHVFSPAPVNSAALVKVDAMVVTFETSHFVRSPFILVAPEKVLARVVALVVTHLLIPVPARREEDHQEEEMRS